MSSNAQLEPSRLVAQYAGVQIHDMRQQIEVLFTAAPRRGVLTALKYVAGFNRHSARAFRAQATPKAIFDAQAVLTEFYGEQLQGDETWRG